MNPNEKPIEDSKPSEKTEKENPKPQRKLKFKTLDGNIKHLECDYDIKISELKKKLAELYKIEPNRQRLLNKGKQFKDDEYLDKLVDKDDTTIHLVFRSEADVKRAQENIENNSNSNSNNSNQNTQNINPFQNILSVVTNSDEFRNLTNSIVNQLISGNTNDRNNRNNNNNNNSNSINISTFNNYQTLNVEESLNLNNSPLQPIQNSSNESSSPPPLNLNQNNTQNPQNNQNESNKNLYSSQFPIATSSTDKKYEMHLKNIEKELNEADQIMSQDIQPKIPLPLLNTTQNVFTAISRSIRKYVIVNQNVLCHLMRLADLMEREQFITQSDVRMNGNKLLDQAYKSLLHISKASNDLSNVIKSSNFNTAPNTGYIGIICQEIGLQSTPLSMSIGQLNPDSILSALRGRNNNNNSQNNLNMTTINLNNLGNNANNNQNRSNITGTTLASIPISISVINSSSPPLNLNNNINNQQTSSNITTNNSVSNNEKEKVKEKKEISSQLNEQKQEDKKKEIINNININNSKANNQNNNTNANIIPNSSNNNDLNSMLGNVMNQLMTPENMNSIVGTMGSILNNPQINQDSNANQGDFNIGNIFGNLMNSLAGDLDDRESPENQVSNQQNQKKDDKKIPEKENENGNNKKNNTINNYLNDKNISSSLIFKKLIDNPQLRKEIKVGEEKKIGEIMEPNIEFAEVSNEIISKLTIQDIFNIYNLNFEVLSKMRKDIKSKYFVDKSKNDEVIEKVVKLLCERFTFIENQLDKLIPGKEFNLEEFFKKELKKIFTMFIEDNEINLDDESWEQKFRKLVIDMFKNLINEIENLYETGEEGAKSFIEFNIIGLIENFIGQKYFSSIQNYDDDVINNFVENLFKIIKSEENKNNNSFKNKEIKENEEKTEDKKDYDNNNERPTLLSIDEIFKIANKDKQRLEKEKKENSEEKKDEKKFSDFYNLTSLFKN